MVLTDIMAAISLSRHKFRCVVDGCDVELISDKLKKHYRKHVESDRNGKPRSPDSQDFNCLADIKQIHTRYFYKNGFDRNNLPCSKTPANAPLNPWALMGISLSSSKRPHIEPNSGESHLDNELLITPTVMMIPRSIILHLKLKSSN